jgi:HKD family nuclease
MVLITNINEEINHKSILTDLISWSEECTMCTSFFDEKGLEDILPSLLVGIKENNLKVKILSNGECKYTRSSVAEKLSKIKDIDHKVIKCEGRRLHSKIYLFEKGNKYVAIIGSANLTHRGLIENEEVSIKISGLKQSEGFYEIKDYLENVEAL